jgi:AcrR family transcriptional regulator
VPPALLSRDQVIDKVMLVVRRSGYDGASLAELSKATGLGKSSLYHHFPNGKDDMVRAVLEHLEALLRESVFVPLRTRGPAQRRVEAMVETIDDYYRGGREACVLGNLVLGTSRTRFSRQLQAIFDEWIEALSSALIDAGLSRQIARARAEDAVIRIEGALVLAGAMGDVSLFQRSLKQMPSDLLAPPARRS